MKFRADQKLNINNSLKCFYAGCVKAHAVTSDHNSRISLMRKKLLAYNLILVIIKFILELHRLLSRGCYLLIL